jgi:acetyl esterase/lipase
MKDKTQSSHEQGFPIPLWPKGAPGALGTADQDIPALTPFPASPGKAAVVICPGGGYEMLADHEGRDYALRLNREGLACFVLKYRLSKHGYRHPAMLQDAARALRWVRSNAAEMGVDPGKIGIMGSSAGGHLASTLLTHFDAGDARATDPVERASSRPDFGILCYPVISMRGFTHGGSRQNLLGEKPAEDLMALLSNEEQVTARTPPAFLWHADDDPVVPVRNSLEFAAALDRFHVPFGLHIYAKGGHGLGLGAKPPAFEGEHAWVREMVLWLKEQGIIGE